jgi:predicted ATPase
MYGKLAHTALTLFAGPDLGVFCRSYQAHLLWHRGAPDDALAASNEAIAAASRVGSPFSMAIALDYAALLDAFRAEPQSALEHARNAISVCERHDFAYYGSIAEIVGGWAAVVAGDRTAGLARLRAGLDLLKNTGAEIRLPFYYGLYAEASALNGNMSDALANIATAFAFQNKNGEMWSAADLHRRHGDLLRAAGNLPHARSAYGKSILAARQAGSTMFELRAHAMLASISGDSAHA